MQGWLKRWPRNRIGHIKAGSQSQLPFEEAASVVSTTTLNQSQSPRGRRKYIRWVVWYLTYFFIIKRRQENTYSFNPLN